MEVIIVSLKSQHCHYYSRVSKQVWNTGIQGSWKKLGELLAHILFLMKIYTFISIAEYPLVLLSIPKYSKHSILNLPVHPVCLLSSVSMQRLVIFAFVICRGTEEDR